MLLLWARCHLLNIRDVEANCLPELLWFGSVFVSAFRSNYAALSMVEKIESMLAWIGTLSHVQLESLDFSCLFSSFFFSNSLNRSVTVQTLGNKLRSAITWPMDIRRKMSTSYKRMSSLAMRVR